MRLSNSIEERDADAVLSLMETSIQMTCTDENGQVDVDIITVGSGKAQREKKVSLKNQIKALSGGRKNVTVSVEALVEE
jgi:DNA replicative helicase MCM subunit Mcm2 (Cdc46/Mcm family)